MRLNTRTLVAAALLAPATLAAQDVAIRNATIITINAGDIENGTILVRNGKITAVGKNVTIPSGVRTIDGTGKFVMPGIIDAHSHAALENGINEGSESVTPEVIVQLRNDDPVIQRALAGGVTAALLGITAAVGTIEVGKLANLVVVTGNDLFASGSPIKHVFVEGRLY